MARLRLGLAKRDLALKAGLSNAYVTQVERATTAPEGAKGVIQSPGTDAIERLADVLGVRAEWLAFGTGEMELVVADTDPAPASAKSGPGEGDAPSGSSAA
jgi:transcriptional regulator with XRE-family HTH domain